MSSLTSRTLADPGGGGAVSAAPPSKTQSGLFGDFFSSKIQNYLRNPKIFLKSEVYASRIDLKPTLMYIKNAHIPSTSTNINFGHIFDDFGGTR